LFNRRLLFRQAPQDIQAFVFEKLGIQQFAIAQDIIPMRAHTSQPFVHHGRFLSPDLFGYCGDRRTVTLSRAGTNIQDSIFMAKQAIIPSNCKQALAGASTEPGSKVEKIRAHRCGARAQPSAYQGVR
jgi:hypothetical protein